MKKRTIRIGAAVGAAALALVAITAGNSFAESKPTPAAAPPAGDAAAAQADGFLGAKLTVPDSLAPPPGNRLDSVFKAKGVQNYGCKSGAWSLNEPAASLTGITLKPVRRDEVIHFRGPSWQSEIDGSLVEGKEPISAPSATPNSIPQLRITAARTTGTGTFGGVTYIQRLATVGGVAPTGACTEGQTQAVRYSSVYRFFKAA